MESLTRVHHDHERLRLASIGGLLLVHVRLRFTLAESAAIYAAQEQLRESVGRHAIVVIVSDVRTELSDKARSFARRTSVEFADSVVCVAHVIEPRGVIGAAVRCVMAGMRAINQPPYPMREFASSTTATMWTAPQLLAANVDLPIASDPDTLLEWLEYARAPREAARVTASGRQ
jgi:hypothetical protein